MNNDELKNKIVKVLQELRASKPIVPNDYGLQIISCTTDREIADALIAAGIGDVKEVEHRAELAERALRNAAPRLNCRGGLGKGFCKVDKCDYYHCNNDDGCVKAHLDQAEKELAEEKR